MRRHTVAVAIAATVLLHGPAVARAATHRTARTRTTVAHTTAVPNSPITITVPGAPAFEPAHAALRPGSSTTVHVTITNTSTTDRTQVSVTTLDAILEPAGNIVPGTTAGAAPGSGASSWLGLGNTVLVLQPGASIDEPITVTVPLEAAGGSVAAVVRATVMNATPLGNPIAPKDVALNGTTTTFGVRIDVQAPKRAELDVASVGVTHNKGTRIQIGIDNTGSSSAIVTGTFTIGSAQLSTPIRTEIPAHAQANVFVAWPKSLPKNRPQSASVTLHHGIDNAQWSGTLDPRTTPPPAKPKPAPATTSSSSGSSGGGLGAPWWVLAAIVAAVLWLGYEVYAASQARKTGGTTLPLGAVTALPLIDGSATARLHDELEPLVAAITALAQSMQPRSGPPSGPAANAPDGTPPTPAAPEPGISPEAFEPPTVPPSGAASLGGEAAVPLVLTDDLDAGAPHVEDDAFVVGEPAMPTGAPAPANLPVQERPWEPRDVLQQILDVLQRIDPRPDAPAPVRPRDIAMRSVVDTLTPDELIDAVAGALGVAPEIVRHWLSDEALHAATSVSIDLNDAERLVHEHQVLIAQVEVLKRALSDLG